MPPIKFKKLNNYDPFSIKSGEYESVEGASYRKAWTEDSFMKKGGVKETVGRNFDLAKINFLFIFLALFLLVIIGRVGWLQIVKGDYYYKIAEGNRIRVERVEAKRGVIYDRNLVPLSGNAANFLLYVVPVDLPDDENKLNLIISMISSILGDKTEDEIKNILAEVKPRSLEAYQPLFIADNIDYEKAMKLYLKSEEWPGVILTNKSRREYLTPAYPAGRPNPSPIQERGEDKHISSLSHILGYTGKISPDELKKAGDEYIPIDYIGKTGTEYFWESDLKGVNGKKQIEVDALGKEKNILNEQAAEDGHNLVLSIDALLQKKIEEIMSETLKKLKLSKGSVIVMNPNNGEVLAMVSEPAFDNNIFARGITPDEYAELINNPDNPLFNRSVSGEYPSGSTIKPVMSAAALEEGVITENTSFLSVGGIGIGQWFFPDWKAGGHGVTNVRKALAESVNTFYYYIGGGYNDFKGLGVDRIVQYGKLFGMGAQTGIDLAGEASGFLPTEEWKEETKGESWYIGDTYHMAIGQGDILVTPLQVAAYTGVFANGGKLYRPHLVKEILSSNDELIREIETDPIRENFINSYNINIVREGMRQAVTAGSARNLADLPFSSAGKTGTAQWSTQKSPHAWFTGFAPYDNPEVVITVLVEEGGEGSAIAVPIAKEVLKWYFGNRE
jgi:penicillin-binding protein 2